MQWPTADEVQQFYNEVKNGREPIDGENIWLRGEATRGEVYKGNGADGSVFGLFAYNGSRYMFAIVVNNVASVNDIFAGYLRLRTLGMMPS